MKNLLRLQPVDIHLKNCAALVFVFYTTLIMIEGEAHSFQIIITHHLIVSIFNLQVDHYVKRPIRWHRNIRPLQLKGLRVGVLLIFAHPPHTFEEQAPNSEGLQPILMYERGDFTIDLVPTFGQQYAHGSLVHHVLGEHLPGLHMEHLRVCKC